MERHKQKKFRLTGPIICPRGFLLFALFLLLSGTPLPADEIALTGFPQGKWLDTTWQAYWTFGENSIRLLDVHDKEIYNFAGIVQNMSVTSLPKGGVRLTFDCEQAKRSYLFEKITTTSPMQMVIRQKGSSIAYKMAMPPVSDSQLTDYKAAVIAEKPAELAKIVAAIQDIPSSAKAAQQAKQAQEQTEKMLLLAASADFDQLEKITTEAQKQGILDLVIQTLEAEAAKSDAPPSVFITLSVLYGRKNLKTQSYAALELAEKAPVPPDMNLNIGLLYGRKKLLAGAPDAKTFMVGDLEIGSIPEGVIVYLDDIEKGSGSMKLSKVAAGSHIIKCVHSDYEEFSTTIELGVGQTQQVVANMIFKPCYLLFSPFVYTANVLIDDIQNQVKTPRITLSPGKHHIQFFYPNSKPIEDYIEVKPGETIKRDWVLEPSINPWNISSDPEGATVSLDGQLLGVTPLTSILVSSTEHEVLCVWPDKQTVKSSKENFFLEGSNSEGFLIIKPPLPFLIPTKTIKLDGKNNDWADVPGFESTTVNPGIDPQPNLTGNMLSKSLICQDDTYIYWYMEFSDGKPNYSTAYSYAAQLSRKPNDIRRVALKLFNSKKYDSNSINWKSSIPTNLRSTTDGGTAEELWDTAVSTSHFRIGSNFIEARFLRASLLKVVSETEPLYLTMNAYIEQRNNEVAESCGIVCLKK